MRTTRRPAPAEACRRAGRTIHHRRCCRRASCLLRCTSTPSALIQANGLPSLVTSAHSCGPSASVSTSPSGTDRTSCSGKPDAWKNCRPRYPRSAPTKLDTSSLAGFDNTNCGSAYCCSTPPLPNTATLSPSLTASSMSWVTNTMVFRNSLCSRRISVCRSSRTTGSTALNGSSISRIGGSAASALATPTRCC